MRIYTVGHSNLDFEDFAEMITAAGVESIVDVRKLPGSRKYPWFNDDHLAAHLPDHGIAYRRSEGLTGRRTVSHTVPFDVNGNWRNRSFHNYTDHALGDEFADALAELRNQAATTPTPSCARRRSGGGATGGSSPSTCSPMGTRSVTLWGWGPKGRR